MDKSLIEAVFEHHSKSHAAINSLQDQLDSLELLRDSAKRSFAALQESGVGLEKSTDSILQSSSHYLIPSPESTQHHLKKSAASRSTSNFISDFFSSLDDSQALGRSNHSRSSTQLRQNGLHSSLSPNLNHNSNGSNNISPAKMRLSESQTSAFDISAILGQVSPPHAFHTSGTHTGVQNLSNGSHEGDELLNILEKISMTGHQLQLELENAKIRETHLVDKIKHLHSTENGFHRPSPSKTTKSFRCPNCDSRLQEENETDEKFHQVSVRCEKLQDAMLSLQDENIKLNRMVRNHSQMTSNENPNSSLKEESFEKKNSALKEKLLTSEQESSQLQQKIERLNESLMKSEKDLQSEKERTLKLQETLKQISSHQAHESLTKADQPSYNEQQLQKLCAELQRKSDKLQKENGEYLKRIDILEKKMSSINESKLNLEGYNLRIDDLHIAIVSKEEEIQKLQAQLKSATEQLGQKDAKHEKMKNSDITKRKEVLLLCEKYEQLKKNKKRLESDLYESQQKLQEASTRCWAFETSGLKTTEENQILKHQIKIYENMIGESNSNSTKDQENVSKLLKDYKVLTEKYETLLDLRLNEYDRVKKNSTSRKSLKQSNLASKHHQVEQRTQCAGDMAAHENSILSESMRRRQLDFQSFYMKDSPKRVRSKSVGGATFASQNDHDKNIPQRLDKWNSPYSRSHDTVQRSGDQISSERSPRRPKELHHSLDISSNSDKRFRDSYTPVHHSTAVFDGTRNAQTVPTSLPRGDPGVRPRRLYESQVRTSTPVKTETPKIDKDPQIDGKLARDIFESKKLNLDSADPKKSNELYSSYDRLRENGRIRSKSLSPIRVSARGDGDHIIQEYRPNSSRESQKSVSFNLSSSHRRSKSNSSILDRNYLDRASTPVRQNTTPAVKRTSLSPVEVLERVKSAYQEEYLQNMAGVNFILSPQNSPPGGKESKDIRQQNTRSGRSTPTAPPNISEEINTTHKGAMLCAERYKKNAENIKALLDKNYREIYDSTQLRDTSTSTNSSSSPKSILKKPRTSMEIRRESNASDDTVVNSFDSTTKGIQQNVPLVVREREYGASETDVTTITDISPPEMFQDRGGSAKSKRRLRYGEKGGEDDIIEIKARITKGGVGVFKPTHRNGSLHLSDLPTDKSDAYDKFRTFTSNELKKPPDVKSGTNFKTSRNFTRSKTDDDLTVPIQLANALKDDDTDSLGQSSVSSTRDHIGRFEFLQEMQTTLKNPGFSYQKNPLDVLDSSPTLDTSDQQRNSDIGLSARQQEYADKLVKKYMKESGT